MLELYKNPQKIIKCLLQKSLILLTNEEINQKIFGVKPHRLDPSLTTVTTVYTNTKVTGIKWEVFLRKQGILAKNFDG